jgi:hypothetical protein
MLPDGATTQILLATGATTTSVQYTVAAKVDHVTKHSLYINWTPGGAEALTLTLWTTPDEDNVTDANATWYQDGSWTLGSNHYTQTAPNDIQHTSGGTTQVLRRYDFKDIIAKRIRVGYVEATNPGVLTLKLCSKTL